MNQIIYPSWQRASRCCPGLINHEIKAGTCSKYESYFKIQVCEKYYISLFLQVQLNQATTFSLIIWQELNYSWNQGSPHNLYSCSLRFCNLNKLERVLSHWNFIFLSSLVVMLLLVPPFPRVTMNLNPVKFMEHLLST